MSEARRIPAALATAPIYNQLPARRKVSKVTTCSPYVQAERPTPEERKALVAEQASEWLVPEDLLGEMEKWALKATDERQRCGRLEAVVWWRRWVRKADGGLVQRHEG